MGYIFIFNEGYCEQTVFDYHYTCPRKIWAAVANDSIGVVFMANCKTADIALITFSMAPTWFKISTKALKKITVGRI